MVKCKECGHMNYSFESTCAQCFHPLKGERKVENNPEKKHNFSFSYEGSYQVPVIIRIYFIIFLIAAIII